MNYFINAYFVSTQLAPTDIYPVQYGEEQCEPDHSFGPCVRRNYLLHYVYSGSGIFSTDNREYKLSEGQMFLIKPNQLSYYRADHDNPWLYRWIEFNGSMVPQILNSIGAFGDNPIIIDDNHSAGNALSDIVRCGDTRFEELMQKFWSFIAALTSRADNPTLTTAQEYIKKAESFIKINIHKKITVADIAEYVGINRSYLSRLFRSNKGISVQQYILSLKMDTAAQYLKSTDISIKEVAMSVGYFDTHVFNKAFKTQFNLSPTEWRRKNIWEQSILE
jgi:AraC-like DNA-binding protein